MDFYCPPRFFEQPELLIKALTDRELEIRFDRSTLQGIGAIDLEPLGDCDRYEPFCFVLRTNRLRANLRVTDARGLPLLSSSPLEERLVEVFEGLGIIPLPEPIEAELLFAESQQGKRPEVVELAGRIRDLQALIEHSVAQQAFEEAARLADKRNALLDQLFQVCTN